MSGEKCLPGCEENCCAKHRLSEWSPDCPNCYMDHCDTCPNAPAAPKAEQDEAEYWTSVEPTAKHKHIGCQTCKEKHIAYLALRAAVDSLNLDAERGAKAETALRAENEALTHGHRAFAQEINALREEVERLKSGFGAMKTLAECWAEQRDKARDELDAAKEEIAKLREALHGMADFQPPEAYSAVWNGYTEEKAARERAEAERDRYKAGCEEWYAEKEQRK